MNFQEYVQNFTTVFVGDYKTSFEKEVQRLISLHLDIEDRKNAVEFLCERYVIETGKRPVGKQLDELASHILYEALEGDTRPDKVRLEEYPVITPAMTKRRLLSRGESAADLDTLGAIANDGSRHGKPNRRSRRQYENDQVEKQAADKAKKFNADYKRATSPSAITMSTL